MDRLTARRAVLLALPALLWMSPVQSRRTVMVAAASDLVYCLEELNRAFKNQHRDIDVVSSTGSSGTFFRQIINGAPFDVYLSADMRFPRKLAAQGLADAASLTPYAIGRLVLWTARPDLDLDRGLSVLRDAAVVRVAIANPEHAPYGQAAKAALERAQIWKHIESKIVYAQNISQAMHFVSSGNADAGILALSLVRAPQNQGKGRYLLIPESMHPLLEQGAVLTRIGAGNAAARMYIAFLGSAQAREIFERYGFQLSPPPR